MERIFIELAGRSDFWGTLAVLIAAGFAAYLKYGRPTKEMEKVTTKPPTLNTANVSERFEKIEGRVSSIERDISHLPKRDELHQVAKDLAVLDERLNGIEQTTAATGRAVGRIEDFMLGSKR